MIVSDTYKFLFFELPRTGTTSIRNVLLDNNIGYNYPADRHISISQFLKKESNTYSDYRVIACTRNPMDRVVSLYLKMQRDHNEYYSKRSKKTRLTFFERRLLNRFYDVRENELSFQEYFLKYYKYPYTDWMYRDFNKCDSIIRFEELEMNYGKIMSELGIRDIPELPVKNKLYDKKDYLTYYTEDIKERAISVFAIYMNKLNYQLPFAWDEEQPGIFNRISFGLVDGAYNFYKVKIHG